MRLMRYFSIITVAVAASLTTLHILMELQSIMSLYQAIICHCVMIVVCFVAIYGVK